MSLLYSRSARAMQMENKTTRSTSIHPRGHNELGFKAALYVKSELHMLHP